MVVFESVREIWYIIVEPLTEIFQFFPDVPKIIGGVLFLSLCFFGWRLIK